jgi:hypothetical protein
MTDEFKAGEYIDEFVTGVPMNYAYRILNLDVSKQARSVE